MPLISVVTAVHEPAAEHLPAAYASLKEQELPAGWDWQWVVQQDGEETADVAEFVPDDPRVSFRGGRRGGPGVARTMALARAEGDFVRVLDSDDQLTDGALARDIDVFTTHPDVGWTTSRVLDLLADGTVQGFPGDPEPGRIAIGAVLDHWTANDYRAQVHPATLCVRRALLLALGGWMALPASEDTGLLLALNAVSVGWFHEDVGLHYRKWEGQMTAQASHVEQAERDARMAVVEARARELGALRWRFPLS